MATTLEQLLDKYVYPQLQDVDSKTRWTRDELTEYLNNGLRDLVTRRPEAGVTTDNEFILGTGSLQPLPSTIVRLKEIVANTGLSDLTFAAEVRPDGYTIDLVFVAFGITQSAVLASMTVDVSGSDNPLVSVTVSGTDTITLVVTNPIYNDDEVTIDYNSAVGTITDSADRELASLTDFPVINGSALYQIRYSAASCVWAYPVVARTADPSVGAVEARPLIAVRADPSASSVEAHPIIAVAADPSASSVEAHPLVAVTHAPAAGYVETTTVLAQNSKPAAAYTDVNTLVVASHTARASAVEVYVLVVNPV